MKEIKVKTWVIDNAQATARRYNRYIDFTRRTDDVANRPLVEDGCYFVLAEDVCAETEKALNVVLSTGKVIGSTKGWKLWIPKSQIIEVK